MMIFTGARVPQSNQLTGGFPFLAMAGIVTGYDMGDFVQRRYGDLD